MPTRVPMVRPPSDQRPNNKLLASLPRDDFQRLRPHLKTIPMAVRQILHQRNTPVREIFFPNGGVVSTAAVMKDGAMVERSRRSATRASSASAPSSVPRSWTEKPWSRCLIRASR